MASITCGNCKASHSSVEAVRACYTGQTVGVALGGAKKVYARVNPTPAAPLAVVSTEDLIEGRYAVEFEGKLRFFKIDMPSSGRWVGYTFVKEQAGDEEWPVRQTARRNGVIAAIKTQGVKASALLYGTELGHCGICGRTLTDEDSRARGIGPVCAEKTGW